MSQTLENELPRLCQLWPDFLSSDRAESLLAELRRSLPWTQPDIRIFGKSVKQPRLVCFLGEPGVSYRYSGQTMAAQLWRGPLKELAVEVSRAAECRFNCVLANLYRDGQDSMGWHADDEPDLGPRPGVASVSLGQERGLMVKSKQHPPSGQRWASSKIPLRSGSLLLMKAGFQEAFLHSIPKSAKPLEARLNLTFRRVAP